MRQRRVTLDAPALLACSLAFFVAISAGCGGDGAQSAGDSADAVAAESGEDADGGEDADAAENGKTENSDSDSKSSKKEKSTSIMAATVERGNLVIPVFAEGKIRARNDNEISFDISGRIDKIHVEDGQSVRKGQLLAKLDGREYEVAITEARTRYLESLSRMLIEEENIDEVVSGTSVQKELEDLWDKERDGKISREDRLKAEREIHLQALRDGSYRRDLVEARTGISSARADEERGKLNLERTELRAPFAGVVSGMERNVGERISTGDLLCSITDNFNLEAEVGVLESDLRGLEVGRPVLLAIPALGETLQTKVDVISPTIDPDSRTCQVLLRYKNDTGFVRPGMFVRAAIAGETHQDRLLVPREAILMRDNRPLLFKIEDNRAKWVYVQLGLQNDNVVEITRIDQGGPLEPGTKVVVSDHLTLTENAKVKVKKTLGLGDPWALASNETN